MLATYPMQLAADNPSVGYHHPGSHHDHKEAFTPGQGLAIIPIIADELPGWCFVEQPKLLQVPLENANPG